MNGVRPGTISTGWLLAGAALAAAVNVLGVSLFSVAAPYVDVLDLARAALPGIILAVAAGAVAVLGRGESAVLAMCVSSLASVATELSVGLQQRWEGWVAVGAIAALLVPSVVLWSLTYPDGGLPSRTARVLALIVVGAGVVLVVAQVVTYDPGTWSWCRCQPNPFATGGGPDAWEHTLHVQLRIGAVVAAVGLVGMGTIRFRARPHGWDLAFACAFAVLMMSWIAADLAAVSAAGRAPMRLRELNDATLAILALLYVAGYVGRRPSRAHVADLLLAAREQHDPTRLRELVARALGDRGTVLGWWDADAREYRDDVGRRLDVPDRGSLAVEGGGGPLAIVISGELDRVGADVRGSVVEALRLASENRRLTAELTASLEQVRDSRARILTASDETRRRIERDLHDGAQQLLISTGIKLNLAAAQVDEGEPNELKRVLDEASEELGRALTELRNLAGGIAPTALAHGSLANALQELALRSHVPTTVRVTGTHQPGELTKSTVFFLVAECLTNVAKHAEATHVSVDLDLADPLRVTVTDDGRGGAALDTHGTGLRGLVDRVEARGGTLIVTSDRTGTRVSAQLPAETTTQAPPQGARPVAP